MMSESSMDRRMFLGHAALMGAGCVLAPIAVDAQQSLMSPAPNPDKNKEGGDEVSPSEDLMREHGILRRVLLAYDEFIRRLDSKEEIDPRLLMSTTEIVRNFVENYHEKQEEDYVFPRLQKAGKQVELVTVLLQQHSAGRVVTQKIASLVTSGGIKSSGAELRAYLESFIRMYRPHAAREDTVLFPAFRSVLSQNEYDSLGEQFEKNETKMFGKGGFEKFVAQVERIEKDLGINDLRQFTPKI